MTRWPVPHQRYRDQQGIVVVWVLIFTTLLALGTWYAVEYATQANKIAIHEQEQLTARAAAEAALNDAQQDLAIANAAVKPTGAMCARNGTLRSAMPAMSSTEFKGFDAPTSLPVNNCTNGQCAPSSTQVAMAYGTASTTTPGLPWWPQSKGGIWNDNFKTYPASFNCAQTYAGATPLGFYTGTARVVGVVRQPEYIIEYIDPALYSNFLPVIDAGATVHFQCQVPILNANPTGYASLTDSGPTSTYISVKCYLFRITARGFSQTGKNEVMLQTFVSRAIN
ncbi:MAG: hypothetical protein QE283_02375 [Rhodoferax sp.]|nr:hypothetical protein [Rhodoferax sp.]